MIYQNLKVAIRKLSKFKTYSLINIGGLAIALAVCLVILSYVSYHLSFDKHIDNVENSYRIISRLGDGVYRPNTFACFEEVLDNNPDVKSYTVCYNIHNVEEVFVNKNKVKVNEAIFVKGSFLDYFSVKMLEGTKESINEPNTMFVTSAIAERLFPNSNSIGQSVKLRSFTANQDSLISYTITGVIEELPQNSHIGYEILLSQKGDFNPTVEHIKGLKAYTATAYLKTFSNSSIDEIENDLTKKLVPKLKNTNGPPLEAFNHHLQPIKDIHFDTKVSHEIRPTVKSITLQILVLVGVLLFAIAIINFVSMHIARDAFHNKELKIVRFLGGKTKNLLGQLLTEVSIAVAISFLIAVLLMNLSGFILAKLSINVNIGSQTYLFWLIALGLFVLTIFVVSGVCFYNILKRSSWSLKSGIQNQTSAASPLVVFQFVLVIGLICFTILMNKQLRLIGEKDLGYSSENVLAIRAPQVNNKVNVFRSELYNSSSIISTAAVHNYPWHRFQDMNFSSGITSFPFKFGRIDKYAIETLNVKSVRYFNSAGKNSENGWFINETFYKKLKEYYTDEQIENSDFPTDASNDPSRSKFLILGVISDFHYSSLHSAIDNFAFFISKADSTFNRHVLVRYEQSQKEQVLKECENKFAELYPGQPFNYSFLSEELDKQYQSEKSLLVLINSFSVLAIMVACFGLIGLSIFITQKRTKEIGVRKVNGAKVNEVIYYLNKGYIKLIGVAFMIAIPLAWYSMNKWLGNFAYKTEISWWVFALAGGIALFIALATVSWQSWRSARRNPVEALRYE